MRRRRYLVLGAMTGVSALAGCTSGGDDGSGADPERAQEHLEEASTAMENAGTEMEAESEKFTESEFESGEVDIRTSEIEGYLETASAALDEAETYATEDQMETIEAARGYVAYSTKALDLLDTFAEGHSRAYSGFTYFQAERFEDAIGELETAETTIGDAIDLLTATRDRYEALDTDVLDQMAAVRVDSVESDLDTLDRLLPAYRAMIGGMIDLGEGMIDFTEGQNRLENEEFGEAEASFGRAAENFDAARSTFRPEEESAPPQIRSTFIEMTCYATALRDGSESLVNAVEAQQDGDYERAEAEYEAAEESLDRCDFSSS